MQLSQKFGLAVVLLVFAYPVGCTLSVTIPRRLADAELEPICQKDAGLTVFQKITLSPDQAKALKKINRPMLFREKTLLGTYDLRKSSTSRTFYGVRVTKEYLSLARKGDEKSLSEAIWFFREGYYEYFQGKHCPRHFSYSDLIDATFVLPTNLE